MACYYAFSIYIDGIKKQAAGQAAGYEVERDKEKAFRYANEGCELGNIYCCTNLSQMYKRGDGKLLIYSLPVAQLHLVAGVKQDMELAEKYKKIALEMQRQWQSNKSLNFQQGIES